MMRENMDSEAFYQKYMLSEEIMAKLESIREALKDNIAQANPMWKLIAEQEQNEEEICSETEDSDDKDEPMDNNESQTNCNQSVPPPSTQFYFTQTERTIEPKRSVATVPQRCDILECACENLERNNGKLDFVQLDNLSDEDLVPLVDEMARKLSPKGIYNLCLSMNDMTVEQRIKYLNIFCTHLLLPKIVELEEPSRLLSSAIVECIKIFPDEVQQLIFVPILNIELKDITLVTTIVNAFDQQRKTILLGEFLACVKELKLWHIFVLQSCLDYRARMTQELSGVTIVIFIAAGVLTILLLFIFAKRQIMRFALRSRRGPHIPIGHDAKKSLKKEIERRIEVIPRIQYEPQLISDPRYILTSGGQAPPHYYRLKAVDDVKTLEAEITRYDNCLKRHPSENLRAYLLTTLATPLNGSGQRLIHQFCDLYEHARHDPTEFGDDEYQVYTRLFLKLMDAARLLKSYPSSRKSSPSRTPIKKNVETKRNILEPRMRPPEEQILTGSRPNTLTVMTLDNSETSV
ncbi:Uncharacterized protein C1orf43 like protein [Trachymyrmex cornetzi]|uniref:Uncharacterized protein C1orf43 like protein n=2 Tax=Trachymyrmex cornetzi TaxID=471704 RepID=A0A195EFU2_9HYME|nr:Uncharacterized protein C1orf43 like protein [Trachymyrmex cornetzi]